MILYIDETENNDYFILTGLLAPSRFSVDEAYKHFKHRIKNFNLNNKTKEKVYREFKSVILDRNFQKIKNVMLEEINDIENHFVVYSVEIKKEGVLKQERKEEIYINLIVKIAKELQNVSIIYDSFNNKKFETKITNELLKLPNVDVAIPKDSQEEPGLQFADNLCSVIRLHLSDSDKYNYYDRISSNVIKI